MTVAELEKSFVPTTPTRLLLLTLEEAILGLRLKSPTLKNFTNSKRRMKSTAPNTVLPTTTTLSRELLKRRSKRANQTVYTPSPKR